MAPDEDNNEQHLSNVIEAPIDLPVTQGRRVPLQRRSLVLSQAAEAGERLPEPSVEMIAYAAARDENADAGAPARGQNKRLRADLTPLSEESLDEAGMNASGSATSTSGRGKAKATETQPRRSTRRTKVARMT